MKTIDLSQFYGTEKYHKTFIFNPKLVHTDGVQYFADQAGAFWLLDIIATEVYPLTKQNPFMVITMTVGNKEGKLVVDDGDDNWIYQKNIEFTDCPDGEYRFYLIGDVLMLPSEY
jgi:hypothetical protein